MKITSQTHIPSTATIGSKTSVADPKIASAASEFESVLLGQWMKDAESSFGSVPGGDEDEDAAGEQMNGFGMQYLASQIVKAGGIGIAPMVEKALAGNRPTSNNGSAQ